MIMTKEKVQAVEKERTQFKRLILQNPNYFSSELESSFEPVLSMLNNTKYEEITCIGFNIDFDMIAIAALYLSITP